MTQYMTRVLTPLSTIIFLSRRLLPAAAALHNWLPMSAWTAAPTNLTPTGGKIDATDAVDDDILERGSFFDIQGVHLQNWMHFSGDVDLVRGDLREKGNQMISLFSWKTKSAHCLSPSFLNPSFLFHRYSHRRSSLVRPSLTFPILRHPH